MKLNLRLLLTPLMASIFVFGASSAHAGSLDRAIRVTFSHDVEIPGAVLPAGSYVFEELELGKLTRVWDANHIHLIGNFLTVPAELPEPAEQGVFLKEGAGNVPDRIGTWFIPGETIGSEFIFTKSAPTN